MHAALVELDWSMQLLYMCCAALGGSVLVLQTLLLLVGIGDGALDVDVDADVDLDAADASFNLLSIRAIFSFFTLFGLVGWWGTSAGWGSGTTLAAAVGSGLSIMLVVAWLVSMQSKLQSKGNLDPTNAVGNAARVYLRIPADGGGEGKITVSIQGRSVEYQAFTNGPGLATGSQARVVRMTTPGTFEVVALTEEPA